MVLIGMSRSDGLRPGRVQAPGSRCEVLGQRPAGDRQAIAVEKALFQEIFQHSRGPTYAVQVLLDIATAGAEIGQVGHAIADAPGNC